MLARREQENFQLIVITHDEKCARRLTHVLCPSEFIT